MTLEIAFSGLRKLSHMAFARAEKTTYYVVDYICSRKK